MSYDFTYRVKSINFKAYYQNNQYKVYAKLRDKMVIVYDKDIDAATEKAIKRLKAPTQIE
jgi:ribosome biogenesis protein Nip4